MFGAAGEIKTGAHYLASDPVAFQFSRNLRIGEYDLLWCAAWLPDKRQYDT